MKYNSHVRDYWLKTFASKDRREQEIQLEAAQTRSEIILGHPFVAHIPGRSRSPIHFETIMEQHEIVLVKLASLSYESKKIIGTILISELKHAIERRPPLNEISFASL
jgi:hypothetical protein